MYKPQTGRPPKQRDVTSIHDHLINEGRKYNEKHEQRRSTEFAKYRNNNPDVDTHSVRMLESRKQEIVEGIFDTIDKHHEGKISMNNLNLEDLSANMIEFFDPIFE